MKSGSVSRMPQGKKSDITDDPQVYLCRVFAPGLDKPVHLGKVVSPGLDHNGVRVMPVSTDSVGGFYFVDQGTGKQHYYNKNMAFALESVEPVEPQD